MNETVEVIGTPKTLKEALALLRHVAVSLPRTSAFDIVRLVDDVERMAGAASQLDGIARVETGPIQFGDDWPGIFIRGDDALLYGKELSALTESLPPQEGAASIQLAVLRGLALTLLGCNVVPADVWGGKVYGELHRRSSVAVASEEAMIRFGLQAMMRRAHRTATNAGWYHDPATGLPKERNFGEIIALMHSELSEALEADRKDLMDDHLPHRKGVEVEFADELIRICDTAAHRGYDLAGAFIEKDAYNQHRADHKLANRANGGKKY